MKMFLVAAIALVGSIASAADFTPYGGLSLGVHNSKGATGEDGKNGHSLQGKLLGSWDFDSFLVDAGVGYQYMELTSSGVKITTKSITGELESRFKLNNSWSFGPSLKVMGGTDNTNSEVIGSTSVNTSLIAKAVYQTSLGGNPFRVEMGVGSTVGLDRNLTTAMVGVQFALPWGNEKRSNKVIEVRESRGDEADFKIDLKMAQVRFDTDKFELSVKDDKKITKLANFLRKNNTEWDRIKISGHTDTTGDAAYNKALSQDRADSVMKLFIRNGVDETKMTSHGFGSNRPVDAKETPDAWTKNRRTEIEFYGVKNRVEFNRQLLEILK